VRFNRFSSRLILISKLRKTLLAMGFQRETASRGTLAMYTSVCFPQFLGITTQLLLFQIVFAVVFEFIVFETTPTPLSIAGAIIIISSAIYTSVI
jgi:drug/metabolite transporter (DMT)-like permease